MKVKVIEQCPVPGGAFDCPYCNSNGICLLENPQENCDDYMGYIGCNEGDEEE